MIGIDEKHSIKLRNGKRIVVCNGHCCDNHGLSEYEYYKKNRNSQPSSEARK